MELPTTDAGDPPGRRPDHRHLRRGLPDRASDARGLARAGFDGTADRRDRSLGSGVRGLPARIPLRLPDFDPRARHHPRGGAAGCGAYLQPHARSARGAAPPLRLSLDRIPDGGARGEDHHDARLQRCRGDRTRGSRRHRQTPARAAEQGARRRRGGRLGGGGDVAQQGRRALAGCVQALDRRRAKGRGGPRLHRRPARRTDRGGGRVNEAPQLPRAARAFVSFVALLRANGFAIAPEQTTAFLEAIALLGPRGPEDIRQAGLATLAPPPERRATYDMLFRIHFLGGEEIRSEDGEDEEVVRLQEEGHGDEEPPLADEANVSGEMAVRAEALAV